MSTVKNFLGGGGGESANIFITGLLQSDSVSCVSPSGRTLNPVWGSKIVITELDAIPIMTSNTTPSGYVAFANNYASSWQQYAYTAFNGATTYASDYKCYLSHRLGQYIGIQFPSAKTIVKMTGTVALNYFADTWGSLPNTIGFALEGSNDGTTWTQIATVDAITSNATRISGTQYYIPIEIDGFEATYSQYRMKVVSYSGGSENDGGGIGITLFQLTEQQTTIIPCWVIPCKEYGTYSISATRGSATTSASVLVDVATDYTIDMLFGLKLYWLGDECEDVTGGWNAYPYSYNANIQRSPTITKSSSQMLVTQAVGGKGMVACPNILDLSNYSKLCMHIVNASVTGQLDWDGTVLRFMSALQDNYRNVTTYAYTIIPFGKPYIFSDSVLEVDISSVTSAYFGMPVDVQTNESQGTTVVFDKVWLE